MPAREAGADDRIEPVRHQKHRRLVRPCAEAVANAVVKEARAYLNATVVVGEHLADQLLIPFALARGGAFTTMPLSQHAITNIDVIQKFLESQFTVTPLGNRAVQVEVR